MSYRFALSPDVHARDLSNWFVLNTRLQRALGTAIHPVVFDDFADLHEAIAGGNVDIVYANAADTALLLRRHGFSPLARARQVADEALVAVAATSPIHALEALPSRIRAAATDAPDVERICRILLEPADLGAADIDVIAKRNYVLVAKSVAIGESEVGFFLRQAFDELSDLTRGMLRPLISSQIYVVSHCLLASERLAGFVPQILGALESMADDPTVADLLLGLGAPRGWERLTLEDAEFMVDLMDTLES
ncbi:MAG: PhnD/SsuA/transferrin family substrate-binding protein [Holophagales bacterium]|nr:MAG: PhnD/SsuA/transferrin family substrate-binding protein [Holophagales bacterium]